MIRIIAVGKIKDHRLADLTDGFRKRIRPFAPLEVVEIKDSNPDKEAKELLARLGASGGGGPVIACDEHGEDLDSIAFSRILGAHGGLTFLIGGPDGLGEAVKKRADRTLRLSSMTFTHEMARLLLIEQIYRGLSILRGKPYHRA